MKRFAIQIEGYHDGAKDPDFQKAIIQLRSELNGKGFIVATEQSTTDVDARERVLEEYKRIEGGA